MVLYGCFSYGQLTCPKLIAPIENSFNSPAFTSIQWTAVTDAIGYEVSMGSSPFENDILEQKIYNDNFTEQINFPPNTTIYIVIIPFSNTEFAVGCEQLSFTTTAECAFFINPLPDISVCFTSNESLSDVIDIDQLETEFIGGQENLTVTYYDDSGSNIDVQALLLNTMKNEMTIWARATDNFECFKETSFELKLNQVTEAETLENVVVCKEFKLPKLSNRSKYYTASGGQGIELSAGDILTNDQRIFILSGAGSCSKESSFYLDIDSKVCIGQISCDYPKFFTPNGDGINDFWMLEQVIRLRPSSTIFIYDRYGKLVHQINSNSSGWDGTTNGSPLPASDYWFSAVLENNLQLKGHFALKR